MPSLASLDSILSDDTRKKTPANGQPGRRSSTRRRYDRYVAPVLAIEDLKPTACGEFLSIRRYFAATSREFLLKTEGKPRRPRRRPFGIAHQRGLTHNRTQDHYHVGSRRRAHHISHIYRRGTERRQFLQGQAGDYGHPGRIGRFLRALWPARQGGTGEIHARDHHRDAIHARVRWGQGNQLCL